MITRPEAKRAQAAAALHGRLLLVHRASLAAAATTALVLLSPWPAQSRTEHLTTEAEVAASLPDSTEIYLQPEIVVTATRSPFPERRIPREVEVVTPRSASAAALATLPDVVANAPGVSIQKTTAGGGSVYMSGMLGNYCLLLSDGIRINNAALRSGPSQYLNTVDPTSVERIEILQGPGSVLYGSDAFGGVINALTPSALAGGTERSQIEFRGQYGGPESRRGGALRLRQRFGRAGVLLNLSSVSFHDLRGGDTTGTQAPTGYMSQGGTFKLSVPTGSVGLITVAAQHVQQSNVPRYDRLAAGKDSENEYNPQRRTLLYARAQRLVNAFGRSEVTATLSHHDQDEGRRYVSVSKPSLVVRERDRVGTWGFDVQSRWRGSGDASLVIGAETYYDRIQSGSWRTDLSNGTVTEVAATFPEGTTYLTSALFAQRSQPISERFTTHVGARLNVFSIHAPMAAPYAELAQTYSEPTGELRLLWDTHVAAFPSFYAGVGRAFRAPNAFDLTAVGTFNAGIEAPNPSLRPERAWAYELGVKRTSGLLTYRGRVYLSDLVDLMVREPGMYQGSDSLGGQQVYVKENEGHGRLWGWSFAASWRLLEGLAAHASAGYAWGQNLTDHEPMQRIPPLAGRLALERTWSRLALLASVDWARAQRRLSSQDKTDSRIPEGGTPGFAIFGLTARLRLPSGLGIDLRADNLLDADYRVHGSGINGGGRSLAVELDWSRSDSRSSSPDSGQSSR